MTNFIQNLNEYINHYGIKQSFIVKRTGIEKNKLSRVLNSIQDVTYEDMISISKALDKDLSYFVQEKLELATTDYKESTSIAFYMGTADESKKELANQVIDLLEHIDAILGIRKKLQKDAFEVSDYGI
jgi:transcriptional regulator with XRE-family HTH domain